MDLGYYRGWDTGFVKEYLDSLRDDGQRKKAAAKLDFDIHLLATTWPRPQFITIRPLKGHEPLWELKRAFQSLAYRIFFCVKGQDIWLLHSLEKKRDKTPASDLQVADARMRNVLTGTVRRA
jgi:phage-related protein